MTNDRDIVAELRELAALQGAAIEGVRMNEAAAEIERLAAIVDRLPVTADGVRVVPGMDVYWPNRETTTLPSPVAGFSVGNDPRYAHSWDNEFLDHWVKVSLCYSTRDAALAAREGAQ